MLKLNFVHVCEQAFVSEYGLPNIIGIFSRIRAVSLPAKRNNISLVLNFAPGDEKKHTVLVKLRTPNGKYIFEKKGDIGPVASTDQNLGLVLNLQNLKLEEAGIYTFEVNVDNNKVAEPTFTLTVEQ